MHVRISVVSVAGLYSAFLSTETATRTQFKNNKNVWDFNELYSPLAHQATVGTTHHDHQYFLVLFIVGGRGKHLVVGRKGTTTAMAVVYQPGKNYLLRLVLLLLQAFIVLSYLQKPQPARNIKIIKMCGILRCCTKLIRSMSLKGHLLCRMLIEKIACRGTGYGVECLGIFYLPPQFAVVVPTANHQRTLCHQGKKISGNIRVEKAGANDINIFLIETNEQLFDTIKVIKPIPEKNLANGRTLLN